MCHERDAIIERSRGNPCIGGFYWITLLPTAVDCFSPFAAEVAVTIRKPEIPQELLKLALSSLSPVMLKHPAIKLRQRHERYDGQLIIQMRTVQCRPRVLFEQERNDIGIDNNLDYQGSFLSLDSLRHFRMVARKSSMLSSSGQKSAFARSASKSSGLIPCASACLINRASASRCSGVRLRSSASSSMTVAIGITSLPHPLEYRRRVRPAKAARDGRSNGAIKTLELVIWPCYNRLTPQMPLLMPDSIALPDVL
jgi:hypothetical protein